jgi:hypothetical protein
MHRAAAAIQASLTGASIEEPVNRTHVNPIRFIRVHLGRLRSGMRRVRWRRIRCGLLARVSQDWRVEGDRLLGVLQLWRYRSRIHDEKASRPETEVISKGKSISKRMQKGGDRSTYAERSRKRATNPTGRESLSEGCMTNGGTHEPIFSEEMELSKDQLQILQYCLGLFVVHRLVSCSDFDVTRHQALAHGNLK